MPDSEYPAAINARVGVNTAFRDDGVLHPAGLNGRAAKFSSNGHARVNYTSGLNDGVQGDGAEENDYTLEQICLAFNEARIGTEKSWGEFRTVEWRIGDGGLYFLARRGFEKGDIPLYYPGIISEAPDQGDMEKIREIEEMGNYTREQLITSFSNSFLLTGVNPEIKIEIKTGYEVTTALAGDDRDYLVVGTVRFTRKPDLKIINEYLSENGGKEIDLSTEKSSAPPLLEVYRTFNGAFAAFIKFDHVSSKLVGDRPLRDDDFLTFTSNAKDEKLKKSFIENGVFTEDQFQGAKPVEITVDEKGNRIIKFNGNIPNLDKARQHMPQYSFSLKDIKYDGAREIPDNVEPAKVPEVLDMLRGVSNIGAINGHKVSLIWCENTFNNHRGYENGDIGYHLSADISQKGKQITKEVYQSGAIAGNPNFVKFDYEMVIELKDINGNVKMVEDPETGKLKPKTTKGKTTTFYLEFPDVSIDKPLEVLDKLEDELAVRLGKSAYSKCNGNPLKLNAGEIRILHGNRAIELDEHTMTFTRTAIISVQGGVDLNELPEKAWLHEQREFSKGLEGRRAT